MVRLAHRPVLAAFLIAVVGAFLSVGIVARTAALAPTSFTVELNTDEAWGSGWANASVNVFMTPSGGSEQWLGSAPVAGGEFHAAFPPTRHFVSGDVVRITDGETSRTLRVTPLSVTEIGPSDLFRGMCDPTLGSVSVAAPPGDGTWVTVPCSAGSFDAAVGKLGDFTIERYGDLRQVDADGDELWSFWDWSPTGSPVEPPPVIAQPLDWKQNPTTGHYYSAVVYDTSTVDLTLWAETESYAVHLGGHLASINDRAEEQWVSATFNGFEEIAVGLSDQAREGHWAWTSGEPVTYTNWLPGEPTDSDGQGHSEDLVAINSTDPNGVTTGWNDITGEGLELFLIEVPELPTTGWLTGHVAAAGVSIAAATVTAWKLDPGTQVWSLAGTVGSDESGDYEIVGLAPGRYRVAFDGGTRFAIEYWPSKPLAEAADQITVSVASAAIGVDADLQPAGRISGAVTTGGQPIDGIQVTADLPLGGSWVEVGKVLTGADGRFELARLPAGEYRVSFADPQNRFAAFVYDAASPDAPNLVSVEAGLSLELRLAITEAPAPSPVASPGGAGPPGSGGSGPAVFVGYLGYRNSDTLAPAITTIIPTPSDISFDPKVVSANLFFAALAMILLTIATEFLNRSVGRLEPALSSRLGPLRRLDRARAALDAATLGRLAGTRLRRLADVIRVAGIVAFYGIVFSFLDPTWDPLSVTGLWLVLIMAVAFGLIGLAGDISAWAMARRWGVASDLDLKTGSLLTAIASTVASRVLPVVPGVMIGSPEALDIDPDRVDQRRLGRIAAVGLGTILLIGLAAWLLTLATTVLRGSGRALDVALAGGEAFLLLVFASAVQNGFVQLLSLRDSAGMALRRTHPAVWAVALLAVTFAFWHTLINPRGDLASAVQTTNVRAFLATVGIVLLVALVAWLGTTLAHYRAASMPFASGVTHAELAPIPPSPARSCSRCGSRSEPDARFCTACGLDLVELATASA